MRRGTWSRSGKVGPYVAVALGAGFCSVLIYATAQLFYGGPRGTAGGLDNPVRADQSKPVSADETMLRKSSESFRNVAKKVGPAVVNIQSTRAAKKAPPRGRGGMRRGGPHGGPGGGGGDDEFGGGGDPFQEFFERFGMPYPMPDQQNPQTNLGSGILIDAKGIVVTNNHVVDGATEILVSLTGDKTEMKAKIIGTDPRSDLAVLRIEGAKNMPSVEWADSSDVEVGDWAIAIGSPFALGQSLTVGVVSAKGNRNSAVAGVELGGDLIQTDAAINPGNSGGPLCDINGRVMGVNTAIYTRSGGYMGIGFAIPSNLAKDVVTKLIADGKIVRGWLGVLIQPLDAAMAKDMGIKEGVGIHEVLENSPAAKAGIRAGDVVVEVEGKAVKETAELQKIITGFKPGQTVKMKVVGFRDKKARTASVKIGTLPDENPKGQSESNEPSDEADKIGIYPSKTDGGIIVSALAPNSVAQQSGMREGDVILSVNRKKPDSVEEYKKLVKGSKQLYLEVQRGARTLFFQFQLPE